MVRPRTWGCDGAARRCPAHSAFGAEVADRAAVAGRFATAARPCSESAFTFAGEAVTLAGMAAGRAGGATESGPPGSFGAEGWLATPGRFAAAASPRPGLPGAFAREAVTPAGAVFRWAGSATTAFGPVETFGAEGWLATPGRFAAVASRRAVLPGAFAGESVTPAGTEGRCADSAASGPCASFGAEVSLAPLEAIRLPVRLTAGGGVGSLGADERLE